MISFSKKLFSKNLFQTRNLAFFSSEKETQIYNKLKETLKPSSLEVVDQSGGCGSMFAIKIDSAEFQGKTKVEQHKLVSKILDEELKGVHGYTLKTNATKTN